MVGDDALGIAFDADRVDRERRARAHGEAAGEVAAVDRVRDEDGIGRGELRGPDEGVDGEGAERGAARGHLGDEGLDGTERGRRLRRGVTGAGRGDDERDGAADRGGTAEEFGSGLLESAFGIDRERDEDGVLGEFSHVFSP
ncbi:hypothetical protein GCM10009700_06830 [Brevibacterium sanguinis]